MTNIGVMAGCVILLLLCACSNPFYRQKETWLGPSEPLDAIMFRNETTGKTNVIIYGFRHTRENGGYLIWKMVPK